LLAYIPKGVLERFRRVCFKFLGEGDMIHKGINPAKWLDIAKPKYMGGWGLKHIHLFGKSLAAKSLWNLLTKDSLLRKST
jgi:hypothetical protein